MSEINNYSVPLTDLMPLIIEQIDAGQTVNLTVKGVSMEPFLKDGKDSVYLVSAKGRSPRIGDIYMFRRPDNTYAMHRVYRVTENGMLLFVGDNQLLLEKVPQHALTAYVPAAIKDGKKVDCEKGFWRNKMTRRMKFRQKHPDFIRRKYNVKRYVKRVLRRAARKVRRLGRRIAGKQK